MTPFTDRLLAVAGEVFEAEIFHRLQAPRLGGDRWVSLHGCWREDVAQLPWRGMNCPLAAPISLRS